MLAQVDDRVRPEATWTVLGKPVIGGQIVVTGRQIGIVIDGDRVLAESTRRLHHQHQVVGLYCGDDDFTVKVTAAVDEQFPGRRTPVPGHHVGQLSGQRGEPLAVVGRRHPDRVGGQLLRGEPVGVLSAALDQGVDQRVAVAGLDTGQIPTW